MISTHWILGLNVKLKRGPSFFSGKVAASGEIRLYVYRVSVTMFISDNAGLKDAMLKLEARFLDGDWTPFTTTSDEEKPSDNPLAKNICRRQNKEKENVPQGAGK